MTSADSPDSSRRRGNLILAFIFVALCTATVVLTVRGFMKWKHGRIASEVLTRAAQGDFGAANQALDSLNPDWIDASYQLRCQLAVWSVTQPTKAFEALEPTFASQPREFQILAAELAIRTGNYASATSMLEHLTGSSSGENQVRFLRAWLAILQKDIPAAFAGLRDLLASEPTHRGAAFLRARLLLESSNYAEVVRGRADLRLLSTGRDALGLEALVARALHRKATDDISERQQVFQTIVDHPLKPYAYFLNEEETLAALLAVSDGVQPATVLPLATRFLEIAPTNPRAISSLAFFLQEVRKPAEAAPILARLESVDPGSATTLQLRCRQLILEQRTEEAISLLEAAGATVATSPRLAGLITVLVDSTHNSTLDARRRALALGLTLPHDGATSWLNFRRRALELFPERREEWIAEVSASATDERALPAAEWLLLAGDFEAALAAVTPARSSGGEKARVILFESLVGLKRYDEAGSALEDLPATSTQGALLRARLALAQGDTDTASAAWRVGYDHALREENPAAILALASGASRIGLLAESSQAFDQVGDRIVDHRLECDAQSAAAWLSVELRLGDSRTALAAARVLHARAATRTPVQKEGRFWESYLGLLLNEDLLGSKDAARILSEESPADARFRALHALAQLKTGQRASALTTLQPELAVDTAVSESLPLQVRVIAVAVCEANDQPDRAAAWKQTLKDQPLLPEEMTLVALDLANPLASNR